MPNRRRRPHTYTIEPTPVPPPANNWINMLGGNIPLTFVISALVGAAVWYGTTNSKQSQNDSDIAALKLKVEQQAPALAAKIDGEATQRVQVRNEFLTNQTKTTEILGQISSRLAVSETKQEATNKALDTTNATLSKIADQLQQLNSRGGAAGAR